MIPEHVMHELRYIEVYTGKKIRNLRLGPYTSPLRGQGFDFDEHRPYRPGDDVRRIDWNVTARMDAPYLRVTQAERELNIMIVMDVSRSMDLGTSRYSKKEAMTFITGSLLFSALSDQINTGFVAFADRVLMSSKPRRTRAAAWSVLEKCWALAPPASQTAILPAIKYLLQELKRTSIVFFVSDFMTQEDLGASKELSMLATKHDVIAVIPEDRAEKALPPGQGYLRVRDVETGRKTTVALGERARKRYSRQIEHRHDELRRTFYGVPMDHVYVPTDRNPVEPVLALFAERMKS